MILTRRYWGVVSLAALSGAAALAFDRPALLVAVVAPLSWLVSRQYAFVRAAGLAVSSLALSVESERRVTSAGRPTTVTVEASVPRPLAAGVHVTPGVPVGAAVDHRPAVELPAGDVAATASFDLTWRVAGRYDLPPAGLVVADPMGLFAVETSVAADVVVDVDPARATDVLVRGGRSNRFVPLGRSQPWLVGQGTDVTDVREYYPGDPTNHVDWKATARRGALHIREFEAETNPSVMLVFDGRSRLATGPAGETKAAALREVALSFVERARSSAEPLGLTVVTDSGRPAVLPPGSSAGHYRRVRERLFETADVGDARANPNRRTPGSARRAAATLRDETGAFAERLGPFFAARDPYVEGVVTDPLYRAVVRHGTVAAGESLTVVCTDDADRNTLVESVAAARRYGGRVLVFLTPTARFDGRPTRARLDEFERLRGRLTAMGGVWAYEVAPSGGVTGGRLERSAARGRAGQRDAEGDTAVETDQARVAAEVR